MKVGPLYFKKPLTLDFDRLTFFVILELAASTTLVAVLGVFLGPWKLNLYAQSHFFDTSDSFRILDVQYQDEFFKRVLMAFFFLNEVVLNITYVFVSNMYSKLVLLSKEKGVKRAPRVFVMCVVVYFDAITVVRRFLSILGIFSNVSFMAVTFGGSYTSSLISRFLGVFYPEIYDYGVPFHVMDLFHERTKLLPQPDKVSIAPGVPKGGGAIASSAARMGYRPLPRYMSPYF